MADPPANDSPVSARSSTDPLAGLSNARFLSLDRVAIRLRESLMTLSAWRLAAASDEGEGAIVRLDLGPKRILYRGEGLFLGWPQERLEAAYRGLHRPSEEPEPQLPQLG